MPDQYLFQVVLEARDLASPTVRGLIDNLKAAGVAVQFLGDQSQQAGQQQQKAAHDAASAVQSAAAKVKQANTEEVASFQHAAGAATDFAHGVAQGIGIAVPLSLAGAASAITRFATDSAKAFGEYERGIREIVTLTGQTGDAADAFFTKTSADVRQFSLDMGVNAVDATKALYEIMSSGVEKPADAMKVLRTSAEAAIGGVTSLHTAADAIVGALNAYQLSADQATRVSDILFSAVKDGRIRWDELGRSLGYVFPTAHQVGVSMEEVAAALATMTNQGVVSQTAMVQLNQLLTSIIKPSDGAKQAAAEMGLEWSTAALQAKGLAGFLQDLDTATGGNADQIAKLIPEIRGMRGAWELTGDQLVQMREYTEHANESLGNTQRAVEEVNKSGGRALDEFNAHLDALRANVGAKVLPVVLDLVKGIEDAGNRLGAWPSDVPSNDQIKRFQDLSKGAQDTSNNLYALGEALKAVWSTYQFFTGDDNPFARLGRTIADFTTVPLVHSLKEGQSALGESTKGTNAYADAESRLTALLVAGQITQEQYNRSLADAKDAQQAAADQHSRLAEQAAGARTLLDAEASAYADATKATVQHTQAVTEATAADQVYQSIRGNINKLVEQGAITEEQANERLARAAADRDAANKAAADSSSEADRALQRLTLAFANNEVSAKDFGDAVLGAKTELRDLTEAQFEQKIKEIVNAWQFGEIGFKDAQAQIRALGTAYQQTLDEIARKQEQAAKQAAAEAKRQADELARAQERETDLRTRNGQQVEKITRDAYQRVAEIQDRHDQAINEAIDAAQQKQAEIKQRAYDDQLQEQQRFQEQATKLLTDWLAIQQGTDDASVERGIRLQRQEQDRARDALDREQEYNQQRIDNRTQANEKLAEIDRKYGPGGQGGDEGAQSEKDRDLAIAAARDDLTKKTANLRDQLSQANHAADAKRDQDVADAQQRLIEAEAAARQRYSDALAADEQRRLDAVHDEFTHNAESLASEVQRALDQAKPKSEAEQAAEIAKRQAAEQAAYEQRVADEQAAHVKALHAAQNVADLDAENARHAAVVKNLAAEHDVTTTQIATAPVDDPVVKARQRAADEQAAYEKKLVDELARHEQQRAAATTDEQRAAERARHEEAQRQLEQEHADALKKIAEESGALTDEQKAELNARLSMLDREHRQRLSDLQDEEDARDEQARKTLATALANAKTTYTDALAKAERLHQDALDKAQAQFDDAKKKADQQFTDAEDQANKRHASDLAKIKEKWDTERDNILDAQNKRFKSIDDAETKDKASRNAAYEVQDQREREDFTRRQTNTAEHLKSELAAADEKHKRTLEHINTQMLADIDASNTALTAKQRAIDAQRDLDYQKFDQDLRDRFSDLYTQFAESMGKLDALIPDDVRRVLQGGAALVGGAVANVEAAITQKSATALGAGAGMDQATFNQLVDSGTAIDTLMDGMQAPGEGAGAQEPPSNDFEAILRTIQDSYADAQAAAYAKAQQAALSGPIGGDARTAISGPEAPLNTTSDPGSALAWALSRVGQAIYEGMCEKFVENAFGADAVYGSASDAARALQTHPGGALAAAPRGALVFFRPDASNGNYGHVGIATGDGRFVSALYTGVAVQPPSPYWNSLYSGWGEPRFTRRAFGGGVEPGQPYMVGDVRGGHGEVFVPQERGRIYPDVAGLIDYARLGQEVANALRSVLPASSPPAAPARSITINAHGAGPQEIVREVSRWTRRQELLDRAVLHGAR